MVIRYLGDFLAPFVPWICCCTNKSLFLCFALLSTEMIQRRACLTGNQHPEWHLTLYDSDEAIVENRAVSLLIDKLPQLATGCFKSTLNSPRN